MRASRMTAGDAWFGNANERARAKTDGPRRGWLRGFAFPACAL